MLEGCNQNMDPFTATINLVTEIVKLVNQTIQDMTPEEKASRRALFDKLFNFASHVIDKSNG